MFFGFGLKYYAKFILWFKRIALNERKIFSYWFFLTKVHKRGIPDFLITNAIVLFKGVK